MSIGNATGGGLAGLLGQAGQNSVNYPGNWNYAASSGYAVTVPPPVFPNDTVMGGLVGIYRVRKLENGYLVESAPYAGGPVKEYFCETLKDVGERIAALGVQKALEGKQP